MADYILRGTREDQNDGLPVPLGEFLSENDAKAYIPKCEHHGWQSLKISYEPLNFAGFAAMTRSWGGR